LGMAGLNSCGATGLQCNNHQFGLNRYI